FDPETVRGVARRLYESLAPGGWLLTASSDPPLGGDAPYETVVTDAGVFYRRPADLALVRGSRIEDRGSGIGRQGRTRRVVPPPPGSPPGLSGWPAAWQLPPARPPPSPPPACPGGRRSGRYRGQAARVSTPPSALDPRPAIDAARDALARGEYARAAELTR